MERERETCSVFLCRLHFMCRLSLLCSVCFGSVCSSSACCVLGACISVLFHGLFLCSLSCLLSFALCYSQFSMLHLLFLCVLVYVLLLSSVSSQQNDKLFIVEHLTRGQTQPQCHVIHRLFERIRVIISPLLWLSLQAAVSLPRSFCIFCLQHSKWLFIPPSHES